MFALEVSKLRWQSHCATDRAALKTGKEFGPFNNRSPLVAKKSTEFTPAGRFVRI